MSARFSAALLRSLALLVSLAGCQPELEGSEEAGAPLETRESEIRIVNSLTTRALRSTR